MIGMPASRIRASVLTYLVPVALVTCLVPSTAHAAEVRKGDRVELRADEHVDDTLVALGETVVIDGHVSGDAVAFAQSVTVRGTIDGNLITAASDVDIAGTVRGDVLTAGSEVDISGYVGAQVYAAGSSINLEQLELVGDAMLAGAEIDIGGTLGRDVYASGQDIEVDAALQRNLVLTGADLRVLDGASVGGDLRAKVADEDDLTVANTASIAGITNVEFGTIDDGNRYDDFTFYMRKVIGVLAGLVFGLLAFTLAPAMFRAPREQSEQHRLGRVAGIGLFTLLATPIVAIFVAVTLIGLPLAALAMGGYVLALYLGKLFIAAELGRRLLRRPNQRPANVAWSLLLGLVLVTVLVELPLVGWLFGFLVAMFGLGSVVTWLIDWQRERKGRIAAERAG